MAWAGTCTFGTDSAAYLRMAELIREGSWHAAMKSYYHPGYPTATALMSYVTGDIETAGFLVSILFGSLAALPLYLLARDFFGRPAALVAVVLYALHWQLVDIQVDVMNEGLYFAALFSAIWMGHRFLESNRLAWSLGAGVAASVAYLTRNEGLIAICGLVCWYLVEAIRRRDRSSGDIFLGALFAVGAFLIVAMPFLVWVRGEMGRWTTTAKGSGQAFMRAAAGEALTHRWPLTGKALMSLAQAHRFVLLIPLAAGLAWAWREQKWKRLYLLSWPVAYLAGVFYSMHGIGYVSYRYLLPPFALLLPFTAWGLVQLVERYAARSKPHWLAGATLVLGLVVGFKVFDVHRWEDLPLVRAGEWIRANSPKRAEILTTRDKVAWHARGNLRLAPEKIADAVSADFVVFTERDAKKPEWPFMPELDTDKRFERVGDDFTRGMKGQRPVRVYRVIKPQKTN
ncbi:MAG TPA: glycosyltransferase family 39 protein [Planctomycetota bacterium]|nr:glycosyltransferase family 39 protein [Planctomycetota bacterium]